MKTGFYDKIKGSQLQPGKDFEEILWVDKNKWDKQVRGQHPGAPAVGPGCVTTSCLFWQFSAVQFSSVQFSAVQCSAVQFSAVQCSSVQFSAVQFSSVQFSCLAVSSSLWPHGPQHARPPHPSPTPESIKTHVHWVGDAIQPCHLLKVIWPIMVEFPLFSEIFSQRVYKKQMHI